MRGLLESSAAQRSMAWHGGDYSRYNV